MAQRVYHFIAYNKGNGESKEFRAVSSVNIFGGKCICLYEGDKMICPYTTYGKYFTMEIVVKQQIMREYPSIPWDVRKVARGIKPFPPSMYLDMVKDGTI